MISFECPGCTAVYSVDDEKAGKTGQCPKCQAQFVIPKTEPPSPTSPPPQSASQVSNAPVEVAPCPGCQVRLSVSPQDLGTDVECPYCKTVFPAQAVSAPAPPKKSQRRSRRDRDDDEDRPSRRRAYRDDDEDDYRPRRSRKPGEISAIGGMLLGGGIYSLVYAAGLVLGSTGICCLWPGTYLGLVWGVLAIVRGSSMLGQSDLQGSPRTLVTLQIVTILNFDVVNCVMGIIGLVLLNNPNVQDYYNKNSQD